MHLCLGLWESHLMSWYFDLAPHLNLWNRIRTEKKAKKTNKETMSKPLSLQFISNHACHHLLSLKASLSGGLSLIISLSMAKKANFPCFLASINFGICIRLLSSVR